MTEPEKLHAGLEYDMWAPEIDALKLRAMTLCRRLNTLPKEAKEERTAVMRELFGSVGENAAVLVRLVGDMALRARCSSLPQKVLNSPNRTGAYFMELLAGEKKEMLYQVCLDAKGKLLTCRCISKGSVAASPVSVPTPESVSSATCPRTEKVSSNPRPPGPLPA